MLENKDYCDYDTSITLGELGFPLKRMKVKNFIDGKFSDSIVTVLLYEAQKWLREEKGIFVYIDVPWKTDGGLGWSHFCCNKPMAEEDKEVCFASGGFYDSYEEALSEGIKQSVKILKEKR